MMKQKKFFFYNVCLISAKFSWNSTIFGHYVCQDLPVNTVEPQEKIVRILFLNIYFCFKVSNFKLAT